MLMKRTIRVLLAVLGMGMLAAARPNTESERTGPAPALGQTAPVLNPDNPPLSSLDEPGLEMRSSSRSFVSYGLSASETADSNANNLGKQGFSSVTHLQARLTCGVFIPRRIYSPGMWVVQRFTRVPLETSILQALGVMGVTLAQGA